MTMDNQVTSSVRVIVRYYVIGLNVQSYKLRVDQA